MKYGILYDSSDVRISREIATLVSRGSAPGRNKILHKTQFEPETHKKLKLTESYKSVSFFMVLKWHKMLFFICMRTLHQEGKAG